MRNQKTSRSQRQREYARVPKNLAIVIDNGSYSCRSGWAGEAAPVIDFKNVLNRPKHRASGETVNLVGDYDPSIAKYFDFTRSSSRSAFDGNVVFQFETMECILDYAFDQLGIQDSVVDHPVLLTECPCNPLYSRSKMAELLFETYDIPSIAFGTDAVFSYLHNQKIGSCDSNGIVLHSGYTTTHAIPIAGGEPVMEACCRTSVGGHHITDYLMRLLNQQYPYHGSHIVWDKVESLKMEHCYIAENYSKELQLFQKESPEAVEKTRCWQLPWVPPPEKEQPNEEQLARKAAIKEKQGQRLREMAAAKRSTKLADLESEVHSLEQLLQEVDGSDDGDLVLLEAGYATKQEAENSLVKATAAFRKAKGEAEPEKENDEISAADKYPLLELPDSSLTEEQLKDKRKQKFLKTTAEGRSRAKQKRHEAALLREREQQMDEERRLSNPEKYLEEIKSRHAELTSKFEQRKKQKVGSTNGINNGVASGGRSERLSAVQRERMRLLTKVAFDRGKDEETFGMNDEDWHLYKQMDKDYEDEYEIEEEESELSRLTCRLKELDPEFTSVVTCTDGGETTQGVLSEKDYRINLGVERFRCPEMIFEPWMVGVEQAGVGEMVSIAMERLAEERYKQVENGVVLLSGGNCWFDGFKERMEREIRMCRPLGSEIRVVRAVDPSLDAWHGASSYAMTHLFSKFSFTKSDYEEKGQDWLRKYTLRYSSTE